MLGISIVENCQWIKGDKDMYSVMKSIKTKKWKWAERIHGRQNAAGNDDNEELQMDEGKRQCVA